MHELCRDARRERDGARGGGVVHTGNGRAVGRRVLHGHRLVGRLVQGHREHEVAVLAVALGDGEVGDGHRRRSRRGGVDVVVDDGRDAHAVTDDSVDRRREVQGELLVELDHGVAGDRDADSLDGLTGGKRQGADRGRVVSTRRGGGAVGRRVADRDRLTRRLGQGHREGERRRIRVAFGGAGVTDGDGRPRNRRRRIGDQRLPLGAGGVVEGHDVAHLELAEADAGQRVGLVVVDDGDAGRTTDLVNGELVGFEPAEVQRVCGRVEVERGVGAVLPRDRRGGAGLPTRGRTVSGGRRPVVGAGDRHPLGEHLRVGHGTDAELQVQPVFADLGVVEDEVRGGELGGGDTLQDQGLTGPRVRDDDAFGGVGHVELFAGAVVAEVDDVGGGVERDAVDLADFMGPRIHRAGRGGDAVFPRQCARKVLAQMIVDDGGETVDGELAQRHALDDRRLT